jgi:hypothetical protein
MSLEPISLRMQGKEGWLRPGSYLVAVRAFWGLLHDLDITVSGERRGSVTWEISALKKSGPAEVIFIGHVRVPPKDFLRDIEKELLNGVRMLRETEVRPVWYSNRALEKLKVMAQQAAIMDEMSVAAGEREERLESRIIERIDQIVGTGYESLTSVVGRLDSVTVNGTTGFRVRCETTGKHVKCQTAIAWVASEAKDDLGKRVAVYGKLAFNSQDEPMMLEASGIELFPQVEALPNISFMSGRISKLTGDLKVGEYIAALRR